MGLDAVVFCDCVEKKRLRVPHPHPRKLYIDSDGSPEIRSDEGREVGEHDQWMELPPCKHPAMMVGGCYVGNAGYIGHVYDVLKAVLKPPLPKCPVLLERVLYDGTHTGDYLTVGKVQKLSVELEQLKKADLKRAGVAAQDLKAVREVVAKLDRVVKTSQKVNKPIAF